MPTIQAIKFWPFIIYSSAVLLLIGIMIGLSHILGERHREKTTDEPYESGIPPTGDARLRFSLCPLTSIKVKPSIAPENHVRAFRRGVGGALG